MDKFLRMVELSNVHRENKVEKNHKTICVLTFYNACWEKKQPIFLIVSAFFSNNILLMLNYKICVKCVEKLVLHSKTF